MWCRSCQQDVPAVASTVSGRVVCTRCHSDLQRSGEADLHRIADHGVALDEQPSNAPADPVAQLSDWQAERRIRDLARRLRAPADGSQPFRSHGIHRRLDPPQMFHSEIQRLTASPPPADPASLISPGRLQPRRGRGGQVLAWLLVLAGMVTFGLGLGLAAWALTAPASAYWNWSLGLTFAGQGLLILGLFLVLLRLWQNSRWATDRLQQVHVQVATLQRTAETLIGQRQANASAFYGELARGASPQVLIASLKGQLEELAGRLGR